MSSADLDAAEHDEATMADGVATQPCRCPECGSDPSRLELYLDNGFGFSLSKVGAHTTLVVNTDPAEDFIAFYFEQIGFLDELRREVTVDEWSRWSGAIRAAFASAMEQAAREVGSGLTAADVTKHMLEADILCRVVFKRLRPNASIDEWNAECKSIFVEGMTPDEAALVTGLLKKITRSLAASKHELGRDVADRLRTSHLGRWHVVDCESRPRRTCSRAPRTRRLRRNSLRARSPGRRSSADDDPPPAPEVGFPWRCGLSRAILQSIADALSAGENDLALKIALDALEADGHPGRTRCPQCGFQGFPGAVSDHVRFVHGAEGA